MYPGKVQHLPNIKKPPSLYLKKVHPFLFIKSTHNIHVRLNESLRVERVPLCQSPNPWNLPQAPIPQPDVEPNPPYKGVLAMAPKLHKSWAFPPPKKKTEKFTSAPFVQLLGPKISHPLRVIYSTCAFSTDNRPQKKWSLWGFWVFKCDFFVVVFSKTSHQQKKGEKNNIALIPQRPEAFLLAGGQDATIQTHPCSVLLLSICRISLTTWRFTTIAQRKSVSLHLRSSGKKRWILGKWYRMRGNTTDPIQL